MQRGAPEIVSAVVFLTFLAAAAEALEPPEPEIRGNRIRVPVEAPGFKARLTLEFERAVGFVAENLGLSVRVVAAERLQELLPAGVVLPAESAVLIRFDPPPDGGLSMRGVYTLEIETRSVRFTDGCPLRLFKALPGGLFEDATAALGGGGGFWVRGEGEGAAEWLVAADHRLAGALVEQKFERLESLVAEAARGLALEPRTELWTLLGAARLAWNGTDAGAADAAAGVDAFLRAVAARRGGALPDVWRSPGDLRNTAGELRAAARTLRFSLALASHGARPETIRQPEE